MARKRAPGGGRKPISATAARPLTIRIDDDLRGQLEAAADRRAKQKRKQGLNWNLSQEILHRLRWSINKEREDRRNPVMRDLCFLISDMASRELQIDFSEQRSWHRDPFIFRAFRSAVAKLLERLQPPGEMRPPSALATVFEYFGPLEAERIGEYAADKQFIALHRAFPLTMSQKSRPVMRQAEIDFDELEEQWQFWPRIRRVLGIEEPVEDEL
jgi:hypothetical protein